jgi:hypothetical protein
MVGARVMATTYCLCLLRARADTPRTLLQNIHSHLPDGVLTHTTL